MCITDEQTDFQKFKSNFAIKNMYEKIFDMLVILLSPFLYYSMW